MMKVQVALRTPHVRFGGASGRGKLYPFTTVDFQPQEELVCPFCGKHLSHLYCDCKKFKQKFALLQEAKGDAQHNSYLSYGHFGSVLVYGEKIENLSVNSLKTAKILELGPDFWDDAISFPDTLTNQIYWVKPGIYEDGKIQFYCKNLATKKVYFCEVKKELEYRSISLTSTEKVTVSLNNNKIGGYRFENRSHKWATFANWQEFCNELRAV